jgi:hypothetical protein
LGAVDRSTSDNLGAADRTSCFEGATLDHPDRFTVASDLGRIVNKRGLTMSERIELKDPLFRLVVRFSNGETLQHLLAEPVDARSMPPDARYAVVSTFSVERPNEVSEIDIINLRDVTFIKTERVTLDDLAADRRKAGIRSADNGNKVVKTLAQFKFV